MVPHICEIGTVEDALVVGLDNVHLNFSRLCAIFNVVASVPVAQVHLQPVSSVAIMGMCPALPKGARSGFGGRVLCRFPFRRLRPSTTAPSLFVKTGPRLLGAVKLRPRFSRFARFAVRVVCCVRLT